jgi:hypothetical protein
MSNHAANFTVTLAYTFYRTKYINAYYLHDVTRYSILVITITIRISDADEKAEDPELNGSKNSPH